jgi:hypothetical protein
MRPARKRQALQRIEELEKRLLWSVGVDANGWTNFTVTGTTIYVSSSTGSDSNPGTINAPVQTLTKAQSLSSSGPNAILLKSGDTFTESSSSTLSNWKLSGQNAANPFILSYYGTGARPMIYAGTNGVAMELAPGTSVNYLDVLGLQFDANLRDPTLQTVNTSSTYEDKGFEIQGPASGIRIEDCTFNYFGNLGGDNLDIEGNNGAVSNITLFRDVVDNAYDFNGGKCEGLYAYNVNGLSILQSTFDHDGWNSAYLYLGGADIGYNHDIYEASTCTNSVVQYCTLANAAYAGLMARGGGNIDYNIFINDAVGCSFGDADGADSAVGGVSGNLIGNVVVGDKASQTITYNSTSKQWVLGAGLGFGQGFVIANTKPGANVLVQNNIFTQDSQNAKPAITLTMATGTSNPSSAVGINDLTIQNNIANGFRIGIQTDGRFVPGGTGLYALNDLKVLNNDFINNSTQEVRHDGTFSSSQESWSGDRFYDAVLSQSAWVTLGQGSGTGQPLAFSTWAANYDLGAIVLSKLPYANPAVSIATYNATLGGSASVTAFLTQADQLSIYNYQPQYMATNSVPYIDAGFNVSGGSVFVNGPGTPPTATATTTNLTTAAIGSTTYTFTVNYTDGAVLNLTSLGNSNLLVNGPNGFSQYATYVSAGTATTDSGGYQHTAVTYKITAPSGAWAKGQDGTYTIELLPNQITDNEGNVASDAIIGSFSVNFTGPTAVATVSNVNTSGGSTYTFSVTYADPAGIDTSTLGNGQVTVSGPNGYSRFATLNSQSTSGNGSIVASYSVATPGGSWASTANGTYTVSMAANAVYDLAGNSVAGGVLATFIVAIGTTAAANTGSIAGIVFNDASGSGVYNSRDNSLYGVTVFLDQAGTGTLVAGDASTTTDINGNYSFANLSTGRYTVIEIAPSSFAVTTPSSAANVVTLTTASPAATGINFADQVSSTVVNTGNSNNGNPNNGNPNNGNKNRSGKRGH